jgi:putative addiction module component (TIGR02574 family)
MDMTVEDVRAAAMQLDSDERAALTAELLDIVDRPPRSPHADVYAAWSAEIGRRLDLVASGTIEGLTWDQVEERFQASLTSAE